MSLLRGSWCWYWDSTQWISMKYELLDSLNPACRPQIVCDSLSGDGELDPSLRIVVGDDTSMKVATAQHARYLMRKSAK